MIKEIIITALVQAGWELAAPDGALGAAADSQRFKKDQSYFVLRQTIHPAFLVLQLQAHLAVNTELSLSFSFLQDLLYLRNKGDLFLSDVFAVRQRETLRPGFLRLPQGIFYLQLSKGVHDASVVEPDPAVLDLVASIFPSSAGKAASCSYYPIPVMDQTSRSLLRQMIQSTLELPELHLYQEAKWLELLSRIILQLKRADHASFTTAAPVTKEALERYVQQELEDTVTVDAMARHFHMSASALKQRFTRLLHSPIHQYVLHQKLDRARQLLEKKELTVYEVALQAGFSDASHFIRRFKKRFGLTPLQFRRTHGQ